MTFVYNTAVQSTTRFLVFQLLYGRDATCTLDTILPHPRESDTDKFLNQATSRLEPCCQLAHTVTTEQQRAAKRHYDECHRDSTFLPCDLVLLFFPLREVGHSEKFPSKYCGPYQDSLSQEGASLCE